MKEVTHEDWMKNPKPRLMWCWDGEESDKIKLYVICVLSEEERKACDVHYAVRTLYSCAKHCAEIETEEKSTPLNNYELAQLLKCLGVEWTYKSSVFTNGNWSYPSNKENETPALSDLKIRFKLGEWMPATRETVMKWREENKADMFDEVKYFVRFIGWDGGVDL